MTVRCIYIPTTILASDVVAADDPKAELRAGGAVIFDIDKMSVEDKPIAYVVVYVENGKGQIALSLAESDVKPSGEQSLVVPQSAPVAYLRAAGFANKQRWAEWQQADPPGGPTDGSGKPPIVRKP